MVIISGVPIFRIFTVVGLYKCTGKAIALPPASMLAAAAALGAAAVFANCLSFCGKVFLCDGLSTDT